MRINPTSQTDLLLIISNFDFKKRILKLDLLVLNKYVLIYLFLYLNFILKEKLHRNHGVPYAFHLIRLYVRVVKQYHSTVIIQTKKLAFIQFNIIIVCILRGFPGGLVVKSPPRTQETWFRFPVRKIPWRRKWQPTPVCLPGESHGQRNLMGYCPGVSKSYP